MSPPSQPNQLPDRSSDLVDQALQKQASGQPLEREMACELVEAVLTDRIGVERFGVWLEQSVSVPPSAAVIAGVADALRKKMQRLTFDGLPDRLQKPMLIGDTCGTGGDNSGSFNISTAAAIVVAGAGLPIAKHGNRAVSSRTGSADVFESLGIVIDGPPQTAARCLAEIGLCFCYAPTHHPAIAILGSLRRRIGKPTVFNLVGPLCNPAGATVQVIGVGRPESHAALASAAWLTGLRRGIVVACEDGIDEVGLFAATHVIDVSVEEVRHTTWIPEDFGINTAPQSLRADLAASGPAESAAIIKQVLAGERGVCRDTVVLNAAALLWAAGRGANLRAAAALAAESIDSGSARRTLDRLAKATNPR